MKIANPTHYRAAWIVSSLRPGELTGTFVVKAVYQLVAGSTARALSEGERPTGDLPVEGGPEGALYYESDMAPVKVKSDLLLVGTCHAPGGRPLTACEVEFHVGGWRKRLTVIGNRRWKKPLAINGATDPEPFVRMGLGYENAFGGPQFAKNPIGKGVGDEISEDGRSEQWLPNIEDPSRLIWDDSPKHEPSGFGPIPRTWAPRTEGLGTFSSAYMRERWPWFPADFDFSHFNAAPLDQRLSQPLRGDEYLRFTNMHPQYSDYESQLAGDRPQLFLRDRDFSTGDGAISATLREVPLALDSLWIDMDLEKLVLVWRGLAQVTDLKLRDVAEIHVVGGHLGRPPITAAAYQAQVERDILLYKEAEAEEARADEAEKKASADEAAAVRLEMEQLKAEYDRHADRQILEAKGLLTQQRLDPTQLDRPVAMVLKDSDFAETVAQVRQHSPDQAAAMFALIPEILAMEAPSDEPADAESDWTRERVKLHLQAGRNFSKQVLDGLDLTGLDFEGVSFSGASLAGAILAGCVLSGAQLNGANLAEADLTGAALTDADCTDADFTNALMDGADLSGCCLMAAIFTKTSLKKARLEAVTGNAADFSGADLTEANLRANRLTQPDFRASTLVRADFTSAVMPNATLEEANAQGIIMVGADVSGLRASRGPDLSRGDFRGLIAERSQWEDATLNEAQFQGAFLKSANFTSARLRGARFEWADMPKATFEEAVLENSVLFSANLFRASFERATLRRIDLRGANLFEVEFWNVVIEDVLFDGANLKMTKLAGS
jgi:uncharacterized protein YjbI with pentapeptide repeats